jgi:hypothetical protein
MADNTFPLPLSRFAALDTMSLWILPPEVLEIIMSFVLYLGVSKEDGHVRFSRVRVSYEGIRAAMLVCRAWRVSFSHCAQRIITFISFQLVAEDTIIECVFVETGRQIAALNCAVSNNRRQQSGPWGHRIRHLIIDWKTDVSLEEHTGFDAESISSVLAHTPHLGTYSTGFRCMSQAEALCLSSICSATLTSLSMWVQVGSDGIFPVINTLENLEHLSLEFAGGYFNGDPWGHSANHPLRLPKLKALHWHYGHEDEGLFVFLSRCVVGPNCYLSFHAGSIHGMYDMRPIRPFFTNNSFRELCLQASNEFLITFAPEIMSIPKIVLSSVPPPNLLNAPSFPHFLSFPFQSYTIRGHTRGNKLWELMEALLDSGIRQASTVLIELDDNFHSTPGATEVIEKLTTMAVALIERGVILKTSPEGNVGV